MLNAVKFPTGHEDAPVRKNCFEDYGIEIGTGLGDFKGKAWRIGLMGYGISRRNVTLLWRRRKYSKKLIPNFQTARIASPLSWYAGRGSG